MGTRRALATLLVASLVAAPLVGSADPTAKQRAAAGDLVKKAIARSQAGDHDAAIDLYLQAYAVAPTPVLLSNIGTEYQQLAKPVEALKYFCKYLEAEPTGTNAGYATAQAKTLQTQLGHPGLDDASVCKPIAQPGAGSAAVTAPVAPIAPGPAPSRGLFYTGIAVGGVGVAVSVLGVIYGLKAKDISDSISNHDVTQPWPSDIRSQESEGQSDQTKQIAFLVIGGAAVATGAVIAVLGYKKMSATTSTETAVSIAPTVSSGVIGLVASGRF